MQQTGAEEGRKDGEKVKGGELENMVIGVGTDLVEIQRMKRACERDSFMAYTFTEQERRQARESISSLAGDFAVKEAVAKALGTGSRGFGPKAIEALRDELGKPYVKLYDGAAKRARELGIREIQVSISNTREHALAFAVAQGEGSGENEVFIDGKTGKSRRCLFHGEDENSLYGADGAGSSGGGSEYSGDDR